MNNIVTTNIKKFDVVISGGGLSGSLLALSLSTLTKNDGQFLTIAIIEKAVSGKVQLSPEQNQNQRPNMPSLFDNRVLALSHGSATYLKKIGVWQTLKDDACAITDIDVSDRGYFGKARMSAQEQGVNALGYVVDMSLIGKAQLRLLAEKKNVYWYSANSISDIDWHGDAQNTVFNADQVADNNNITVTLNSAEQLSTLLLLACDGAHSPCRQLANIEVSHYDYQQCALITNVSTAKNHGNKAYERFTEFGPIAMLPLKPSAGEQNRCSLVWTLLPEQAQRIQLLDDDAFKLELECAFGRWLGAITHVGKREVHPLMLLQAEQQTYHRMALIGNASHTIHPIAGQGFNLGLRDVAVITNLVSTALKNEQDIGHFTLLQGYEKNRLKDHNTVIQLTDALVTLFANDLPPLVAGRNMGLSAMNFLTPLKTSLVNKTMGY